MGVVGRVRVRSGGVVPRSCQEVPSSISFLSGFLYVPVPQV